MPEAQVEKANDGDVNMDSVEPPSPAIPTTVAPSQDVQKRRPRLVLNAEPRKRGAKSMFGIVLGTLNKAKVEDKQRSASEAAKKRQVLEARLHAKLSKETDAVRRSEEAKRDRILANRKEEELVLKDGIIRYRRSQLPRLANFLITSDTIPTLDPSSPLLAQLQPPRSQPPPLYYLPAILTPEQAEFITQRQAKVKETLAEEWDEWLVERKAGSEEVKTLRARVEELSQKSKEDEARREDEAQQDATEADEKMESAPAVEDTNPVAAIAEEHPILENRETAAQMDEDDAIGLQLREKVSPTMASRPSRSKSGSAKKTVVIPVEDRIKRLFSSLCAQIDGGHLKNAIKTCDKIMRLLPGDRDTLQTKLFLLLQTDQYAEALTIIGEHKEFEFERAYSLYRLQRESDASKVLDQIKASGGGDDSRNVSHLEAQLNYRQGDYQAASNIYTELLDTAEPDSEEQSDVQTNLEAVQRHLGFVQTGFLTSVHNIPQHPSKLSLEEQPIPVVSFATLPVPAEKDAPGAAPPSQALSKPPRKSRLPKHVVLGVTPLPDPERWLKKSERTQKAYGKKRKGGGGGYGAGATQGAAAVGGAPSAPTAKPGGKKKK